MGSAVNISALSLGLAAFALWTLPRITGSRRVGWVNLLGGVGILAFIFSVVSPDDDLFQQELLRSATLSERVSAHVRVVPQRSRIDLSIDAFVVAEDHSRDSRTGRYLVTDQPLELETPFHAPISNHSPPAAS